MGDILKFFGEISLEYVLKYNSQTKLEINEFNNDYTTCKTCNKVLDLNTNYCSSCGDWHGNSNTIQYNMNSFTSKLKFNAGRYRHAQNKIMYPKILGISMRLNMLRYDNLIDKMLIDEFKIYQVINDAVDILKHSMFNDLIYFIIFFYLLHRDEIPILIDMICNLKKINDKYNIMYFCFGNIFISTIMFKKSEVSYSERIINDFFLCYSYEGNIKKFVKLLFAPICEEDKCVDIFKDIFLSEFIVYPKFTYDDLLYLYLEKIKSYIDEYRYKLIMRAL